MSVSVSRLTEFASLGFDEIIDVRSPAEYAEDHVPGAINLPVLNDEERARVGTIYKQVSPFLARKVGAALIARNAAAHIEEQLMDKGGEWRPLLYCWRGGMRSGSFATILRQIGWRAETVEGGYKTYRSLVVREIYDTPFPAPLIVLDGNTGSAKTELLAHLAAQDVQMIDLEALANHRGSLFGAMGPQPSQRGFDSLLADAVIRLDPARPVVVEAESSTVGACRLPAPLWKAMCAAPRIVLSASRRERAAYLARAYGDVTADAARLEQIIDRLRPYHPAERIETWQTLARGGDFLALADGLMEHHYDPRYSKHRARMAVPVTEVEVDSLSPDRLAQVAADLKAAVGRIAP